MIPFIAVSQLERKGATFSTKEAEDLRKKTDDDGKFCRRKG
jgi:hypothetical protein